MFIDAENSIHLSIRNTVYPVKTMLAARFLVFPLESCLPCRGGAV